MLAIKNISCQVSGFQILNDVMFDVTQGEVVGIIGSNGSGKTTLFNTISGFVPVQKGEIIFNGIDITNDSPDHRSQLGLGRVFQNFGVFRSLSVLENVTLAFESKLSLLQLMLPNPKRTKIFKERAQEILVQVGLRESIKKDASALSGGQLRLLEMARAIASDAKLLLLDEPTAGVSPKMKDAVISCIETLIGTQKTVLIIEHDMTFIRSLVKRLIVLDQGHILLDGNTEQIMNHQLVHEIYLGKQKAV